MPKDRIPVILCIDCEPDEPVWPVDQPSAWSGFERLASGARAFRDRLEQATGQPALLSWALRMDPQVEAAYGTSSYLPERFAGFFESIQRIGDSTGVHPHTSRWDAKHAAWVADYEDASWTSTCLGTANASYREAFGRAPDFHRFGNAFMSTGLMNEVRATGTAFDLTLEPGERAIAAGTRGGVVWRGEIPDYTSIPRAPYRPLRSDFRLDGAGTADDDDGFRTVPLSAGRYVPPGTPTSRQHTTARLSHPVRSTRNAVRRLGRRPAAPARPPYRLLAMWRPWHAPTDFWDSAFAAADELEPAYLAFAVRSDLGAPGPAGDAFDAIIGALQHDRRAKRLTFTTLERALPFRRNADSHAQE